MLLGGGGVLEGLECSRSHNRNDCCFTTLKMRGQIGVGYSVSGVVIETWLEQWILLN